MCGYLDYDWEECTEDEYNSIKDSDAMATYMATYKEPICEQGGGIMWQAEHYADPPKGYKYYKARRDSYHYVFLCTSKVMEEINDAIKNNLLETTTCLI